MRIVSRLLWSPRLVSTLVGLLYGAMLPMFARRPIVLGGLIAPVLWSGLLYTMLGLLNPLLASHIDWPWFIASQVAFGVVAGFVVVRQTPMPTRREPIVRHARRNRSSGNHSSHEKAERNDREPTSLSMCVSGTEPDAALCLSSPSRTATEGFRDRSSQRDVGLQHSLLTELRGLPRRARTRRSSDCPCGSRLSRHCG